jgi:betaine-aldehyde dehydrogenase
MTNESYDYVGLAEYRETKHISQNINPKPGHWFEPPQAGVQQ